MGLNLIELEKSFGNSTFTYNRLGKQRLMQDIQEIENLYTQPHFSINSQITRDF